MNENKARAEITVLDHGYVRLVESWGADELIIEAARMSTDKGFEGWGPKHEKECPAGGDPNRAIAHACTCKSTAGDEKLLGFLYRNKHMTPFEMAGMIIEVKAPIMVFREWHRHRTQSYNEMSARYIPLPNENYSPDVADVTERARIAASTTNRQASGSGVEVQADQISSWLNRLDDYYALGQEIYEEGLAIGVPKELARLPTTVGRYSRMRASANLRNWLGFLELRMAPGAQQEIRHYAYAVAAMIKGEFPRTYDLFEQGRA